jgi:hypothetical protein
LAILGGFIMQQSIKCPYCGESIPLDKAFTHEVEEKLRRQFEADKEKREKEFQNLLHKKEQEVSKALEEERAKLERQAKKKAEETIWQEMGELRKEVEKKNADLKKAREAELDLLKKQKDLEDREESLKLEIERTLSRERKKIREEAAEKVRGEQRLKDREKEDQLNMLRKQIEDLKKRSEQGSVQAQGEALELELEDVLKAAFPMDKIEPVAKGKSGADILQKIQYVNGKACGAIIWETKRTKNWNDKWIEKLKTDQRVEKADIAVLTSTSLPNEISRFGLYNGVWVTDFESAINLATALRMGLIEIAHVRSVNEGKTEKMELMYKYLSGQEFKQRIEAIVESFLQMQEDLDAEKRAMQKIWSQREKQIHKMVTNTAGMYGDLQGIIGRSLPAIKQLELPGTNS